MVWLELHAGVPECSYVHKAQARSARPLHAIGLQWFCRLHGKSFLSVTDALAIPAAFILGVGRIGNFIDGQIVGSVTPVCWAVKFPDAEGFRHPVVLYDGMKNLLIIPILMYAGKRQLPSGVLTGIFLFLYAFLRIFIDVFREYPTTLLGLATGQVLNILLSILGLVLTILPFRRRYGGAEAAVARPAIVEESPVSVGVGWRLVLFALLLLFSLVIPSDWTQDVPARYGKRHAGLGYSAIYPRIDTSPERAPDRLSCFPKGAEPCSKDEHPPVGWRCDLVSVTAAARSAGGGASGRWPAAR